MSPTITECLRVAAVGGVIGAAAMYLGVRVLNHIGCVVAVVLDCEPSTDAAAS